MTKLMDAVTYTNEEATPLTAKDLFKTMKLLQSNYNPKPWCVIFPYFPVVSGLQSKIFNWYLKRLDKGKKRMPNFLRRFLFMKIRAFQYQMVELSHVMSPPMLGEQFGIDIDD